MTVFSAKKVEKALEKVGYVNENGDHNRYRLYIDGKRTDSVLKQVIMDKI